MHSLNQTERLNPLKINKCLTHSIRIDQSNFPKIRKNMLNNNSTILFLKTIMKI